MIRSGTLDFVLISYVNKSSHKMELQSTYTGMKVTLVSCKHPLRNQFSCNLALYGNIETLRFKNVQNASRRWAVVQLKTKYCC